MSGTQPHQYPFSLRFRCTIRKILAGESESSRDSGSGLFKCQRHVVAKIGTALYASTAAATSPSAGRTEQIIKSKKIAEDVVKILEDRAAEIGLSAGTC